MKPNQYILACAMLAAAMMVARLPHKAQVKPPARPVRPARRLPLTANNSRRPIRNSAV